MDAIAYLSELAESHRVTIHPDGDGYLLEVTAIRHNPDERTFYYRGAKLATLCQRAWAGEPGDH